MIEHGYQLITRVTPDAKIEQELLTVKDSYRERVWRQVLDTGEAQIRGALIELGWTPPQQEGES